MRIAKVFSLLANIWLAGCTLSDNSSQKADSDIFYQQGLDFFHAGRLEEAAGQFRLCLQQAPDSVGAQAYLGEISLTTGRRELTEQILAEIPEEGHQRPEVRALKARIMISEGRDLEAKILLEETLKHFPHSTTVRLHLARLSLNTASTMDLKRAGDLCEEILQQIPHQHEAGSMLLKTMLRQGNFHQAKRFGEQLSKTFPQDPLFSFLGGTAAFWGRDPSAVVFLQQAVDLSRDYAERLKALWLLKLAFDRQGGYPAELPGRFRFQPFRQSPPLDRTRFTDIAVQAGVDKVDRGRGSAWLDFDLDGDLDIFTVGIQVTHALYRNDGGGQFQEVSQALGLSDARGGWGASCADYDNDGHLDLYVTRDAWEGRAPNSLYHYAIDKFIDVAPEAGVADSGSSFTATWGDYDLDGYLDLYVANGVTGDGGTNSLYHNLKTGKFADTALRAGVADSGRTIGVAFGDYDGDLFPDLYAVNIGQPNRLYHNNGDDTFTDVALESGVIFPLEGGYVTFFFDYNNDGELDLFTSTMGSFEDVLNSMIEGQAIEPNRPFLYRNNGDGTFIDVTRPAGLARSFGSMGIGVGDVDNNGYPDIYLSNGGPEMSRIEPNTLFINQGDGTFADITEMAGVGNLGKGHGATFADFDEDGDLDLYAGIGGHYDGDVWANSLYRNEGADGHYLQVETVGTTTNQNGIGARVAVFTGARRVYGYVASGYGFGSSNALPLHLGLSDQNQIDSLTVDWPSGLKQRWIQVPVDCQIRIKEGEDHYEVIE